MKIVSRKIIRHAHSLAKEIDARAALVLADAVEGDAELRQLVRTMNFRTILITRSPEIPSLQACVSCTWVTVPDIQMTRTGQIKVALLICLARGILERGDRVVCLTGIDGSSLIDTFMVLNLGTEPELFSASDAVTLKGQVNPEVFERTLTLATQLAVEGREGRPVGTIFVLGDSRRVLAQARNLVLNPFHGHPESGRNILDPRLEETIKEFSAIDGAYVLRDDGVVLAAGVQLLPTAPAPQLLGGLGTRHAAAAAITMSTAAVAIAVSQSTGTVSVFKSGEMVTKIHKPTNGAPSFRLAASRAA
jgi:DNA integrity scanning protein DisA with diadenylate cyclase activity